MRRKQIIRRIQSEFACQRCNRCCRTPGFVFLTFEDTKRIAAHFGLDTDAFMSKYGAYEQGRRVLNVNPDDSCIFLDESGCSIHQIKPKQCRDFPRVWRDPEAFDYCEGIKKIKTLTKVSTQAGE
ncbi:MAG: YkgJ family cysteine cluster protein [Candidatus Omnitrophota bacterium]|nr:YkgJ family cysteine cluster protein [Candidatus Omnitrophota bacterium]